MRSRFEEKTFENYFNAELDTQSDIFFPPGQVQEGSLGFDASAFSRSRMLWRGLGFPFWFHPHFAGAELREVADVMERHLGALIDDMPAMKANLLFQYKRPEFITLPSGREWPHWNMPYYRYDIYQEQQELLMEIHRNFHDRILILYASPALYGMNELVSQKLRRAIISSSNFTPCDLLDGHHRNTYTEAGLYSIACSDPENIAKFDLIARLNQLAENDNSRKETNREFIINFRRRLVGLVNENPYYGNSFRFLNDALPQVYNYELLYSFLALKNIKELTGIQWLVKL